MAATVVVAGMAVAADTSAGFVATRGADFVLNGSPFRFVGANAYYLMITTAEGHPSRTEEVMQAARQLGFTVLRTWAFNDRPHDPLALQPSPAVYNETAFRSLDYVLDQARRHGIRLILPLVNGPPEYGGVQQYVAWCAPGSSVQAFYSNPRCRELYKSYVSFVLNRTNVFNNRRYKDDPTILAWELANEPHLPDGADVTGTILRSWVAEMAAHIKSIDPRHLVATGEDGYDTTEAGYSSLSAYGNQRWLFDGTKGISFTANTADPNIDFASIHFYPEPWKLPASAGHAWIADHIRIARAAGKPLVLGEFGHALDPAPIYEGWLRTLIAEGGGGALVWQLMCPGCGALGDRFATTYPPANTVSDVLAAAAARAKACAGAPSADCAARDGAE